MRFVRNVLFKKGARTVQPWTIWALNEADYLLRGICGASPSRYSNFDMELTVTHLLDGQHQEGSLHYTGDAADIRTVTLEPHDKWELIMTLPDVLNHPDAPFASADYEFQLVMESEKTPNEHLHIERDLTAEAKKRRAAGG